MLLIDAKDCTKRDVDNPKNSDDYRDCPGHHVRAADWNKEMDSKAATRLQNPKETLFPVLRRMMIYRKNRNTKED